MTATLLPVEHDVGWMTASPLWRALLADPTPADLSAMQRPVLLRMTNDDFMAELVDLLADHPDQLAALEATPVSYRLRPPAADASYQAPIDHLKLFQPVHGHFNLVAASLACRVVGLPDKAVDPGADEAVTFVMRRLQAGAELAWTGARWSAVEDTAGMVEGEETLPMFEMTSSGPDRTRRVLVGMVPTSSTASSKGRSGGLLTPEPGEPAPVIPDQRPVELQVKVVDALTGLQGVGRPVDATAFGRAARVDASQFLLLDLVDVLARHVPLLWTAVQQGVVPTSTALREAYLLLDQTVAGGPAASSWRRALVDAYDQRTRIWGDDDQPPTLDIDLKYSPMSTALLRNRLVAALPAAPTTAAGELPEGFESPKLDPRPGVRYVIRCVYRRPQCRPDHRELLSEPTVPFAIASFFDGDAPARQVHIAMPLDTTLAGLRKGQRNVRVTLSRELQGQMQRVTSLKKALDGELDEGSLDLGMICSFSLPIITIAALILLIGIVIVLNLVFWWVPLFKICFPVPVKGKP